MPEYQIVLDYLLQNNLIESEDYADNFISIMSENWINSILDEELSCITERRRFKAVRDEATGKLSKVKQEKVPLWLKSTPYSRQPKSVTGKATLRKTKEGKWEKYNPHNVDTPAYHDPDRIMNPKVIARIKQGMSTTPPENRVDVSQYGKNMHYVNYYGAPLTRHPHGGKSEGEGPVGSKRGVKKQKGAKGKEVSPVSKFLKHRKEREELLKRWEQPIGRMNRSDVETSLSLNKRTDRLNALRRRKAQRDANR